MSIRQLDKKTLEYFYTLDVREDGKIFCPCPAGIWGKPCRHKTEAENFLKFLKNKNIESANKEKVPKEPVDEDVVPF